MDKEAKKQAALAKLAEAKANVAKKLAEKKAKSNTGANANTGQGNQTQIGTAGQQTSTPVPQSQRNADTSKKSSLFKKPYIEFDFSTMQNSNGGFMAESTPESQKKIDNLNWLESLSNQQPPFDFSDPRAPTCFECTTKNLDFRLFRVFNCRVCPDCRRKHPEKYSLLTKTECKQDYLLTESELRDTEILPHMERPNPYQQTYSNMMLYLRYQVEEFAFKKWGSEEKLDLEFERREEQKKERKQRRFEEKLRDMRNKTRAQAVTKMGTNKHVHIWSAKQKRDDGTIERKCGGCGTTRTELDF